MFVNALICDGKTNLLNRNLSKEKGLELDQLPRLQSDCAFILGNGTSLSHHDLNLIRGIPSFASNAIYLIFEKTQWRPDYYSCVDTVVLPDQSDEISIWIGKLKKTIFCFPRRTFPHETPFVPQNVDTIIEPRENVCFFDTLPVNLDGSQKEVFSLKGDDYIVEPMSVTITLMQLAVRLGAKKLFLIGCDTEYKIPAWATILDQDSRREDKRIILDRDEDPNHFDPRYFGKGKVWHSPNTDLMIRHYEKVKGVCDQNGIQVYNAGIGGKLEVFPRLHYKDAIDICLR